MSVMIETFNLTKKFDDLTAVEDLCIQVNKGEILGFLGPNGAGKTTTIRMLAGIIAPTEGYALVKGIRAEKKSRNFMKSLVCSQKPRVFMEDLAPERICYILQDFTI